MHTAAAEIDAAGGTGLAIVGDVREEESVQAAIDATIERFGGSTSWSTTRRRSI